MFDSKKLLDALISAAAQGGQQQPQQGGGGLGGLLGQVMGAAQGGPQAGQQGGAGGGLGGLLGGLLGGAQQPQAGQSQGGAGGLGGLLGSVLGGAQQSAQNANQRVQDAGGIGNILGSILGQATGGLKDAAGRANAATGAQGKLEEMIAQATGGKNSADILAQLQQVIGNNQMASGAILGTLGSILLGTQSGRSITATAAKLGGLALIGGLAYRAYQNYLEGKPLVEVGEPVKPAPLHSQFHPDDGDAQANATLLLRGMIAAAAADGLIDETERKAILGNVQALGIDQETLEFLNQECANPPDAATLASEVQGPEQAAQLYTAARLAVDLDNEQEQQFMADLAAQLGIDDALLAQLEAAATSVKV